MSSTTKSKSSKSTSKKKVLESDLSMDVSSSGVEEEKESVDTDERRTEEDKEITSLTNQLSGLGIKDVDNIKPTSFEQDPNYSKIFNYLTSKSYKVEEVINVFDLSYKMKQDELIKSFKEYIRSNPLSSPQKQSDKKVSESPNSKKPKKSSSPENDHRISIYDALAKTYNWNNKTFTGEGLDDIPVPNIKDIENIKTCDDIGLLVSRIRDNNKGMEKLNTMMLLYTYELGAIYNRLHTIWEYRDKSLYKGTKFIDFLKSYEGGIYKESQTTVDRKRKFADLVEISEFYLLKVKQSWSWFSKKLSDRDSINEAERQATRFASEVGFAREKGLIKVPEKFPKDKVKEPTKTSSVKA